MESQRFSKDIRTNKIPDMIRKIMPTLVIIDSLGSYISSNRKRESGSQTRYFKCFVA